MTSNGVRTPGPASQSRDKAASLDQSPFAIKGKVAPIGKSASFHLQLWAVTLATIILPGVYFGLILLDLVFLIWFTTSGIPKIVRNRLEFGMTIYVVSILLAGLVLLGVLLAPIFRNRGKRPAPFVADRKRYPRLYEMVFCICRAMGAPYPAEIHLDCKANASAHLVSILDDKLVLTLGLPLLAGMDVRQLAGVIAHELAHFRQSESMRLASIVQRVQNWFSEVSGNQFGWDLAFAAALTPSAMNLMAVVIQVTRPLFFALMYAGAVISSGLSRQMELDADRYMAKLIGSEAAAGAMERLPLLAACETKAISAWQETWMERRKLYDNMPGLVASGLDDLSQEAAREILEQTTHRKSDLFDTHPAMLQRVSKLRAEKAEGIFSYTGPARQLVDGFDGLCREVTIWEYKTNGFRFTEDNLYSDREAARARQRLAEELSTIDSFFQGIATPLNPISLDSLGAIGTAKGTTVTDSLRQLRKEMLQAYPEAKAAFDRLMQADKWICENEAAQAMLSAGLPVPDGTFSLPNGDDQASQASRSQAAEQLATAKRDLGLFQSLVASRLHLAVEGATCGSAVDEQPSVPARQEEVKSLLNLTRRMPDFLVRAWAVRRLTQRLTVLTKAYRASDQASLLPHTINSICAKASEELPALRQYLGDQPYPFEDMPPGTSLADYVVPDFRPGLDSLMRETRLAVERLTHVYLRTVARLGYLAEEAEFGLGLRPLPAPAKKI